VVDNHAAIGYTYSRFQAKTEVMRAIQRDFRSHQYAKELRVNERIRAREVRLIDENGVQVGIVSFQEAIGLARSRDLDLVEVAPTAAPPVCRITDYGKFKYEQSKKEREGRKKSKATEVKGIRLHPYCGEHDVQFHLRNALRFLKDGDKVKFTVIFRSRQITHPEFARRLLERLTEESAELAVVERPPTMEGRTMTMILSPRPQSTKGQ